MSAASIVPFFARAKSPEKLQETILNIQGKLGAKVAIISISWIESSKEWVCWYLPPNGHNIVSGI